ncbi:MAG TPA: cytochrome c family protein [Myxococcota bacterium]|nr:cytochrome c family protein [Myxococcota bacterium]
MASESAPESRRSQLLLFLIAIGLALLAMAFLTLRSAGAGDTHEFVGHNKCKSCHAKAAIGDQYGLWLESRHAKAMTSLATEKAKQWASEAGVADPQTDARCVECHTTAHGVPDAMLAKKFDRKAGVQCEACHGAGKDYRKKKIMIDRDKAIAKGLVPQTEAVCVQCHNDKSPAWDPQRYTLADGRKVGFDYDQAVKEIAHPVPEGYDPMAEGEAD